MARNATRKRAESEEHTHLALKVEGYEASVSARVNHLAYEPQYGWHSDGEEPVYELINRVVVSGTAISPEERAGDRCEVTLYGSQDRDLDARLKDLAELDEHRSPRFRTYRGREVPVYKTPLGLGLLDKVRVEPAWRTYLFVKPVFVDRWLALLGTTTGLFVELRECKVGRDRWIRSIGLQTTDPTED
jgi:hypothetical protein